MKLIFKKFLLFDDVDVVLVIIYIYMNLNNFDL